MASGKIIPLIEENKNDFFNFLNKIVSDENKLHLKGDLFHLLDTFKAKDHNSNYKAIETIIEHMTESVSLESSVYFEIREVIGRSDYYIFNLEEVYYERITATEYLKAKEKVPDPNYNNDLLTLNFKTFYKKFPSVKDYRSVGKGFEYLNKYLSSRMFNEPENLRRALFEFLFMHKYKSQQLIVNDRVKNPDDLVSSIEKAMDFLRKREKNEPYNKFKNKLQEFGFEPGLGNNVSRIIESLEQLYTLLESPDHEALRGFISRIPMIFNIVAVSVHGYFGQQGVLGKPDTGGQVVYVLDQVKALEHELIKSLRQSGVNARPKILVLTRLIPNAEGTTCNKRLEKIFDTKNSYILRIPFRDDNKNVTDNWISRFEIWPYLEDFAEDAYTELLAEFGARPDFIMGNYSDGNIVASLLTKKFGVTQCNIAHALEKCKYLYSDLYWNRMEDEYHFSIQFTADLLAMNSAHFLLTSSYQEIAGTTDSIGQYESYLNFTMPGLYRVNGGINLFHPKFNIVPPGVNAKIFFPYKNEEDRLKDIGKELEKLLFGNSEDPEVVGQLADDSRMPLFSMARLDSNKNLTALVKWFGENERMQELGNLIIVAGKVDANQSSDIEEKEQIHLMHHLIEKYNLHDKMRWIGKLFRKDQTGEVYRIIADRRGIFVQPGLFEGFGLTILEAMLSGLPVFATLYGGPREIIQDEISGFHIDPINEKTSAKKILSFMERCQNDPEYWDKISEKAIDRVNSTFNWELHAEKLLSLSKIYGFWKYTTNIEMKEMNAYLDVLFHLLFKPRANQIRELHRTR